jgi:hypothetical protein
MPVLRRFPGSSYQSRQPLSISQLYTPTTRDAAKDLHLATLLSEPFTMMDCPVTTHGDYINSQVTGFPTDEDDNDQRVGGLASMPVTNGVRYHAPQSAMQDLQYVIFLWFFSFRCRSFNLDYLCTHSTWSSFNRTTTSLPWSLRFLRVRAASTLVQPVLVPSILICCVHAFCPMFPALFYLSSCPRPYCYFFGPESLLSSLRVDFRPFTSWSLCCPRIAMKLCSFLPVFLSLTRLSLINSAVMCSTKPILSTF